MTNSFGFGGHNATLLFRAPQAAWAGTGAIAPTVASAAAAREPA
jgi:hypothetical protein